MEHPRWQGISQEMGVVVTSVGTAQLNAF